MMKKELWVILAGLSLALFSCTYNNDDLGVDILPPGDSVGVKRDTIIEIAAYPMMSFPNRSSENVFEASTGRLMVIGQTQDSVFGLTRASIMTQVNTTTLYIPADNVKVDSITLNIDVYEFLDEKEEDFIIRVHELSERLYMDSTYYTDHDMSGSYDPSPLAEYQFTPDGSETLEIMIDDVDFIDRFISIMEDTAVMASDSLFKDEFPGFYLTAESLNEKGDFAYVQMNTFSSALKVHYWNDSTKLDLEEPWKWLSFTIDPYYAQKVNVYEHDFSGTRLENYIGQPDMAPSQAWVQGMSGVNTRLSFSNLNEWMARSPLVISSAQLVWEVVPEEESGIAYDDLPERLMLFTALSNDSLEFVYDYLVNVAADGLGSAFGGYKKAVSGGFFDNDTTYRYTFNMGLHFQYMVEGDKLDNDFILRVDNQLMNPASSLLRASHPSKNTGLRLEIVYLQL